MTINRNAFPIFDRTNATERRNLTYTGPSSYATGGDSLTPQEISLSKIVAVVGALISNGTNIYWGYYNGTTEKLLWYSATGTEIANGTDLSGFTGAFEVIGR